MHILWFMANRWKRTEHPNPLLKSFRPLLGAPWEPTDQRSRGQINSSSSRSHGWGQQAIADTFLPCCSEPQRGHPEPLDKPAALVIIIVRWFLFCSSWGIFWIDLLCCAIHPSSYGVCCYPGQPGGLAKFIFLSDRRKTRDPTLRPSRVITFLWEW